VERFNLENLSDVAVKENQVKISDWFEALENLVVVIMMMMISVELGNVLEYENFSHRESMLCSGSKEAV
jgi:hypothetical protein